MGEIAGTVIGLRSIFCNWNECKKKVELESALYPLPGGVQVHPQGKADFALSGDNTVTKGNKGVFFTASSPWAECGTFLQEWPWR